MASQLAVGDTGFFGLDTFNDPKSLPDGFLPVCDNLSVMGGRLAVRPGKQGQLAAATGQPFYRPTPITQSDGTTHFWYASNGQLRRWIPGSTTTSQITYSGMPSLSASTVCIAQGAGYVYAADGSSVGLMRFLPDGSTGTAGGIASGMVKPDAPTSVKLTHQSLLPSPGTATWGSYDANAPLVNLITQPTPTSSNTAADTSKYWKAINLTDVYFGTFTDASACVFVGGTPQVTFIQTTNIVALSAGTDGSFPTAFYFVCKGQTKTGGDDFTSRFAVKISLYDVSNNLIDERQLLIGLMNITPTGYSCTFDCRDAASDIHGIRVTIYDWNAGIVGDDPGLQNLQVYPAGYGYYIPTVAGTALTVYSGTLYASPVGNVCSDGNQTAVNQLPQVTQWYARGRRFYTALSADLSQVERISVRVKLLFNIGTDNTTPIRIYISNYTSGTETSTNRAYSEQVELSTGTVTDIDFDVTTVDASIRGAVTRIGLEWADDIPIPDQGAYYAPAAVGGISLLEVDYFTKPGNLTPGTSITYLYGEWDTRTDYLNLRNVVQSDGSDQSIAIVPTLSDALATVTLPAKKNNNSALLLGTYFVLYRFGDFNDGYGRLVGLWPYSTFDGTTHLPTSTVPSNVTYGADTNKGAAPYYAAPANPYISVDYSAEGGTVGAAGIVITDNTPSSWLFSNGQVYIDGREAPPAYIRDITFHNNRLCLLCGNATNPRRTELYLSWLLSSDANAGLYFTRVLDPNDPNAPIKGFYDHVGTEDNDRGLRAIGLEDRLVLLFEQKAPYTLIGTNPSNYSLRQIASDGALGLSARDAALLYGRALVWLTPNGLVRWNMSYWTSDEPPQPFSLPIQGLLNPNLSLSAGSAIPAAYYSLCSLHQHGNRLYLTAPGTPTDTANTVMYRFDPREGSPTGGISGDGVAGSWTRWLQGNITNGTAALGASDVNSHYVFGLDGQIYLFVPGQGDKATSGGSVTGIAWNYATRRYGYSLPYSVKSSYRIDVEFQQSSAESAGIPVTIGVNGRTGRQSWSLTYNMALQDDGQHISKRTDPINGETLQVTASGTTKKVFSCGPVRLLVSPGSERRG